MMKKTKLGFQWGFQWGVSMTHTMFDDQQESTFVGQWNCFPGPDRCKKLIL